MAAFTSFDRSTKQSAAARFQNSAKSDHRPVISPAELEELQGQTDVCHLSGIWKKV
jgi:hypothetical protein